MAPHIAAKLPTLDVSAIRDLNDILRNKQVTLARSKQLNNSTLRAFSQSLDALFTPAGLQLHHKYALIFKHSFTVCRPDAEQWLPHHVTPSGLIEPGNGPSEVACEMSKRQDFSRERALENGEKIRLGDYTLGQTLGEGEFGKVKIGWKKAVGAQVAVKIIRREKLDTPGRLAKVHREISILKQLDHPNIVRLHEMVETKHTIGIILEYASGGELFDYILQQRYLKDEKARRLFAQLVSGVGYLHRNGIIHRDLKLENLLLDSNKNIIITDFGFANTFDPTDATVPNNDHLGNVQAAEKAGLAESGDKGYKQSDLMSTSCGSPCYAAPELVVSDGLYSGRKVDVWSCGVILYAMLAGYLPFDDDPDNPEGDNINLLYKYICSTPLIFPDYVTPHARDILKRILVPDPKKRADLFEVARHSWLSDYAHLVEAVTSRVPLTTEEYHRTKALKHPVADFAHMQGQVEPLMLSRAKSERFTHKNRQVSENVGPAPPKTQTPEKPKKATESPRDTKRRTVQVEYVAPRLSGTPDDIQEDKVNEQNGGQEPWRTASQRLREKYDSSRDDGERPMPPAKDLPPSAANNAMRGVQRNGRHVPRSTSDSTAFIVGQIGQQRPSTGGSIGANPRLPPSRGSYGQPSAPAVSNETAQGQVSGPKGYNISKPLPQPDETLRQVERTPSGRLLMPPAVESAQSKSRGHKRSSTVTGISEKFISRVGSIGRKGLKPSQKTDRSHPPTSMKAMNFDEMSQPRKSVESRRSFGFSRNKSADTSPKQEKRHSRRFSLLPSRGKGDEPVQNQTPNPPGTAESAAGWSEAGTEFNDKTLPGKHKRFSDAYEARDASGSSGAARRVMDMFRRRK